MNVQSIVFPSVTDEKTFQDHLPGKTILPTHSSVSRENGPFQDHLPTKTIITHWSCLLGHLDNECAEDSFLLCHLWMAFSRPHSKWAMCSKALFLGRPAQQMCSAFPKVTHEWPFKTIFQVKLSYCLKLSPGRPKQLTYRTQSSPVSPMNGLFTIMFQVKLFFNSSKLCLLSDLNSKCSQASLVSTTNGL